MTSPSRTQTRQAQAKNWLGDAVALEPASSDGSFRSYYRAALDGKTWIMMDAPPAEEDCRPFVEMSQRLLSAGVLAPRVIEQNLDDGFLLLDDFGSTDYLSVLNSRTAAALYADAARALHKIQQAPADELPAYDEQLLRREIQLFPQWLLGEHLGQELDDTFYRHWSALGDTLVDSALSQPQVLVHRDYHSRNLMRTAENNPGVLDFQDAVKGPATYDPISLYRDCYIQWPEDDTENWLQTFRVHHPNSDIAEIDASLWQHWCDLMGVQRHLKAAGIFCRLWHRDGKQGFMADIPRTLSHITRVAHRHPSLNWLAGLIDDLAPRLSNP